MTFSRARWPSATPMKTWMSHELLHVNLAPALLVASALLGLQDHKTPRIPIHHLRAGWIRLVAGWCILDPETLLGFRSLTQPFVHPIQKMAKIFGGLATPPGTFTTSLVTKKFHLSSFAQCSASFSRSKSSPIGQPQPASRTSCIDQPRAGGKG
jgi:hypothetical protein